MDLAVIPCFTEVIIEGSERTAVRSRLSRVRAKLAQALAAAGVKKNHETQSQLRVIK